MDDLGDWSVDQGVPGRANVNETVNESVNVNNDDPIVAMFSARSNDNSAAKEGAKPRHAHLSEFILIIYEIIFACHETFICVEILVFFYIQS